MNKETTAYSQEVEPNNKNFLTQRQKLIKRGIPALLAAGIVVGSGVESVAHPIENLVDNLNGYEASDSTHTYQVQQGDTVWDIVGDEIKNPDSISTGDLKDIVINMPENSDLFENGVGDLQPGDDITLPDEVNQ